MLLEEVLLETAQAFRAAVLQHVAPTAKTQQSNVGVKAGNGLERSFLLPACL